jgi:hypothetical protein
LHIHNRRGALYQSGSFDDPSWVILQAENIRPHYPLERKKPVVQKSVKVKKLMPKHQPKSAREHSVSG